MPQFLWEWVDGGTQSLSAKALTPLFTPGNTDLVAMAMRLTNMTLFGSTKPKAHLSSPNIYFLKKPLSGIFMEGREEREEREGEREGEERE